ncbi:Uncharacterized protein CG3556 [Gryllus bimaculatus]|nr:Uncharacterized protein CG3556 [Gryllus bimaculatus]
MSCRSRPTMHLVLRECGDRLNAFATVLALSARLSERVCACVAEAGTAAAAEEEEAAALRGALRWLRQRRDPRDGAWGNHTAAAVLALQLAAAAPPQRRAALGVAGEPRGAAVGEADGAGAGAAPLEALEAGEESENESLGGNWNRSAAAAFLRSRQGADGAFVDFLPPVIPPALAPKAAHHHHHHKHVSTGSTKSNGSAPSAGTNNSGSGTTAPSNSSETYKGAADGTTGFTTTTTTSTSSSATTSSTTTTSSSTTSTATTTSANANNTSVSPASIFGSNINLTTLESLAGMGKQPDLVKVTYSIWVHSNISESYNLTVQAERNTTFYNVMLLAAQDDSHYHFEATEWPNGHYVHTLAGFKEEPTSYYFWLLYQTAEMPDPANPPGNQLITPVEVPCLPVLQLVSATQFYETIVELSDG